MPGKTVSHYTILSELGRGGMGTVYLAEDHLLKRKVALKFLPRDLLLDETTRTRFIYEAQAASALDHSSIATIFEINENDENPFIAMAYYSGGTLAERIRKKDLTIEQAVKIALCLAEGLQKAHNRNIVHRDIKPANILFSEDGDPKIIDFGLARFLGQSRLSRTGTTVGTIAYMSPEQAAGKDVDHRTDIWALGVILYEMLAGENPFRAEYEQAMMYAVINEDPEFIGKIRTEVPAGLEHLIDRALQKNPEKRFQTMQELHDALQQVLEEIHSGQSKSVPVMRLTRRQRRYALRLIPVVFLILSVIVYFTLLKEVLAGPVSIALLPLDTISREAGQDWFTEGMTDALITDLARIKDLRIISRSSAMRYKGSEKSSAEIAGELGVTYLIEGSVFQTADLVKITVRLIDPASDEYIWAQSYERNFRDILALQGDVARAIARRVEVSLTPNEETYLSSKPTVNPEAHEAYLKGNFHLYKLTPEGTTTALKYFEMAVRLDPGYAPAHAGIALARTVPAQMGYMSMRASYETARPAIEKALELDANLPEIHYMRAVLAAWYEWDWDLAKASFERVLELNPNMAEARAYFAHLLFILHRPEDARVQMEQALRLDPFNPLFKGLYSMGLNYLHRYDEAIAYLQEILRHSPADPIALSTLRTTYHLAQRYDEAIDIWRRSFAARGDRLAIAALDSGFAEGGYTLALRRVAESQIRQSAGRYISPWPIATLYTRAGMPDEALIWFEKALDAHDPNMPYLNIDPIFDDMRSDPRFITLVSKVGL